MTNATAAEATVDVAGVTYTIDQARSLARELTRACDAAELAPPAQLEVLRAAAEDLGLTLDDVAAARGVDLTAPTLQDAGILALTVGAAAHAVADEAAASRAPGSATTPPPPMTTIRIRAFNLREGAAIITGWHLVDGEPATLVVTDVDRDPDTELVTARLRNLNPSIHPLVTLELDYNELVELVGLVVNEHDADDDDAGVDAGAR